MRMTQPNGINSSEPSVHSSKYIWVDIKFSVLFEQAFKNYNFKSFIKIMIYIEANVLDVAGSKPNHLSVF